MTELPQRPFSALPPPPDGVRTALSDGRRLRHRRQALTAATLAGTTAAVVAAVLALGGSTSGAAPDRLLPADPPTPSATATTTTLPDFVSVPILPVTEQTLAPLGPSPSSSPAVRATPTSTTASAPPPASPASQTGYRTPGLTRTYQAPEPLGATVCTPDTSNGRTRAPWCLSASTTRTGSGHDLVVQVCRDQTGRGDLTFPGVQEVEFVVQRNGLEQWRWSTGHDLRGPAHSLAVDAGGCWTWTAAWSDVDAQGRQLPRGDYTLTAVSSADELSALPDETTPFTI